MVVRTVPVLKGPRVMLRPPVEADVDARFRIGRYAEVVRGYGGRFDPAQPWSREDARREIERVAAEPCAWIIDHSGFIGHVRLHAVDPHDRRAALAIGIEDPGLHGQGLGSEAVRVVLRHGFGTGLHRISVRVLASNERAIRCYRRCGFTVEGRERESAWADGRWQDDIVMGLIDREIGS